MDKIVKGYPNWDVPLNKNIDEYNETIGNAELLTKDKTVIGAINEIKTGNDEIIEKIKDDTQINTADISNLKTSVAQNTSSLNDKVNKSSIVNNCNVTEEGFVADARQLKSLNDKLDSIKLERFVATFSSGIANVAYNGIKSDSICILQLNFDRDVGINNLFLSENNIKVTLNDKTINGGMWVSALIKL